jgi:hypothetical protein
MAPDASHAGDGWSAVCLNDADCANGLVCFCGLCSTPCTDSTECTRFSDKATCPGGFEVTSACVTPASRFPKPACAVVCERDVDCTSLGATAVCTGGFCKVPALVTRKDGGIVTCAERTAAMTPAIVNTFARADRSCNADSDCTTAPFGNDCYGNGCTEVPISKSAEASVTSELSSTASLYCHDFFEAGCVGPGLVNCPEELFPSCIDGLCQFPITVGSAENTVPTCTDRAGQIAQELTPYGRANPSSLSCTNDGECLQVNLVSCAGGCGAVMSKSAFDAAAETLAAIDQTYCVPFTAAA